MNKETNRMIDEDIELYSLFRKGDRKAFDTLFLKYYSILCAFGKYYIPIEDAEEVVLDIMTWLWENREFQIIETSLRSYLFMAVRNRCLDLISKNRQKDVVMSICLLKKCRQVLKILIFM